MDIGRAQPYIRTRQIHGAEISAKISQEPSRTPLEGLKNLKKKKIEKFGESLVTY